MSLRINKNTICMMGDILESGETLRVRIRGKSMEPLICDGDVITVENSGNISPGDIVIAATNNVLTCHTVISVRGNKIYLQGERSGVTEGPLLPEEIIGVVKDIRARGIKRRFLKWMRRTFSRFRKTTELLKNTLKH